MNGFASTIAASINRFRSALSRYSPRRLSAPLYGTSASCHAASVLGGPSVRTCPKAARTLSGIDANNYIVNNSTSTTTGSITRLDSVTWTGAGDGINWFDPLNWAGGAVPDLSNVSNVVLPANVTVRFDSTSLSGSAQADEVELVSLTGALDADTVSGPTDSGLLFANGSLVIGQALLLDSLNQLSGSISGAGSIAVTDSFAQTGGTIAVDGDITINQGNGDLAFVSLSGADVSLTAPDGSIIAGELEASGDLTMSAGDDVHFTDTVTVGGNASVTADSDGNGSGGITQDADAPLIIGGSTTLDAAEDIALNNPNNDFSGTVSAATDGSIKLADANDLDLGTIDAGGDFSVDAGGDVEGSGKISIGGTTTVKAGGDVILTNPDNSYGGGLDVDAGGEIVVPGAPETITKVARQLIKQTKAFMDIANRTSQFIYPMNRDIRVEDMDVFFAIRQPWDLVRIEEGEEGE